MLKNKTETRKIIDETVEEVCDIICSTMSPNGNVVTISNSNQPFLTKDGATVAKAIKYKDPYKDLIALQIRNACVKTEEVCGDGTTTTAFIIKSFYSAFKEGVNFNQRMVIDGLMKICLNSIDELAIHVKDLDDPLAVEMLITTANNDKSMVDEIVGIFKKVGRNNTVTFKPGGQLKDYYTINPSMTYVGGYADPRFSVNGQGSNLKLTDYTPIVLENSIVKLDGEKDTSELLTIINSIIDKPIIIFGRSFDDSFVDTIASINNHLKSLKIILVKVSGSGTAAAGLMKDISTVLGTQLRTNFFDTEITYLDDLPELDIRTGNFTFNILTETQQELADEAADAVKAAYDDLPEEQKQMALGRLIWNRYEIIKNQSVTFYVGGQVQSDIDERKTRFEDIYLAAKSVLSDGLLPGCGATLVQCAAMIRDVYKTLSTGDTEEVVLDTVNRFIKVLEQQTIFLTDGITNKDLDEHSPKFKYVNLSNGLVTDDFHELKVWDAKLATKTALSAGVKTAILLLNTSCLITGNRLGSVSF